MFFYCERCHVLAHGDCCPSCGGRNMRSPAKEDYCFLVEADSMFGEMLGGLFSDEGIAHSAVPSGNGMRSQFALRLENLRIFVPYEFFDRAKELLNELLANAETLHENNLRENMGKLFAPRRSEKKIKKILRIAENDSLTAYCSDIIINADRIENKGSISGCTKGGDYLFVYKGNELIIINSATYEILSAKRKK